jgi:uncharacterized protein (DUF2141 family)
MLKFTFNLLTACALLYSCNNVSTVNTDNKEISSTPVATPAGNNEVSEKIGAYAPAKEIVEETLALPSTEPAKQIPLTIVVEKLSSDNAPIEMTIYSPDDNFLAPKNSGKKYRWRPKKGKAVTKIQNLSYGDFAIALYQDVNDNGKIDKNMIGIPEEPYAFSNDYKPVIKAPSFNDCKFSYSATENTVTITLQN